MNFSLMLMPSLILKLEPAHLLVFWFKFYTPSKESISQLYMVKKTFHSSDHIVSRRFLSRCVLLSPCKSESYFVCELPK